MVKYMLTASNYFLAYPRIGTRFATTFIKQMSDGPQKEFGKNLLVL